MFPESSPETAVQLFEKAQTTVEHAIHQAGSLENYLLELQVEQARTQEGRAELLRLQRVGYAIMSPAATSATPDSEAFYHGALLSSALLAEVTQPKKFLGGTFAHDYYWKALSDEAQIRDTLNATPYQRLELLQSLADALQTDNLTWADDYDDLDDLKSFAKTHLKTLYQNTSYHISPYNGAWIGFWAPMQEFLDSSDRYDTEDTLGYVNSITEHVKDYTEEVTTNELLQSLENFTPQRLTREREIIMKRFNDMRAGFASISELPHSDETATALRHYQEIELNNLNKNNKLLSSSDTIKVSGTYFYETITGDTEPLRAKMFPNTEVLGTFSQLTIIDVPVLKDFFKAEKSPMNLDTSKAIRLVPSPAIVLENPTFIMKNSDTGNIFETPEETTIIIPLHYKSARLFRF